MTQMSVHRRILPIRRRCFRLKFVDISRVFSKFRVAKLRCSRAFCFTIMRDRGDIAATTFGVQYSDVDLARVSNDHSFSSSKW